MNDTTIPTNELKQSALLELLDIAPLGAYFEDGKEFFKRWGNRFITMIKHQKWPTMTESNEALNHDLPKTPTGIQGLDELTGGGLPKGRPSLLCGSAGCGKTLVAMEFLVRGAMEFGEPGVFMAFEERTGELAANFASLGHDLNALVAQQKLVLSFVHIERSEIEETGEYDLEGLFIRLGHAIDSIGAKRVVLDTIEALFSGLSNTAILRAELRRLFRWLKDKGMTAIITGERGENSLTRYGLEEYVADCVILLDHRVAQNMATRRLRIVKYRGSSHGTSEYPFLIDESGISILPITSMRMKHEAGTERVSSGVPRLDAMMGGHGYYRGSSVLVSGTAGSGKTSLAAHFAAAAAARGERCLWFAFEESSSQIIRNMRSIGLDLGPAATEGRLRFLAERPTLSGLEMHLVTIHKHVKEFLPQIVIIDPISNFSSLGSEAEIQGMLVRLIDFFKMQQITTLFTSLTSSQSPKEATDVGVSSLMDAWLLLRDLESGAERNRGLHLLKSRGMAHSNQVREFLLTDHGVELRDVYLGPSGALLTGTARNALEVQERAQSVVRRQQTDAKQRTLQGKRQAMEARISALRAEYEAEQAEILQGIEQDNTLASVLADDRLQMGEQRQADASNMNR
jgi:circadian clock protein KaiC